MTKKKFVPKRTLYKLTFEDPDLEDLEVTCKGTTMRGLLNLADLADKLEDLDAESLDSGQLRKQLEGMLAPFGRLLESWNVADEEGSDVPANLDGLLDQEMPFIVAILTGYTTAMTQAPPPLPAASTSGATSPEESSLDLASASTALPSSPKPT